MPAPLAKGIIITVSVLIAAGLAAYESPEVRRWVENSRRKIAMALHSLGDEISPNVRDSNKHDPSMDEEKSDEAEERRRKAREEILERRRVLEERKKRKSQSDSGVGSFDSLVDDDGNLKQNSDSKEAIATTSALEQSPTDGLTRRGVEPDAIGRSHTLPKNTTLSNYETELRDKWNLPLPPITTAASQTSHASESLLDLTPTSAEFPDPDISIPDANGDPVHSSRDSDFFSMPPAPRSRTLSPASAADSTSYYYAHPSRPDQPLPDLASQQQPSSTIEAEPNSPSTYYYAHPSNPTQPIPHAPSSSRTQQPQSQPQSQSHSHVLFPPPPPVANPQALSSTLSVADTSDLEHIRGSDLGGSSVGGDFSEVDGDDHDEENGDGVRTPEGSIWTDVGSSVSGDR